MSFLLNRLKEKNTIAGIISLASLLGINLSQEEWQAVFAAILALVQLWQILRVETPTKGK